MVWAAILLIFGILAHTVLPDAPVLYLLIGAIVSGLALLPFPQFAAPALALALFLAGLCAAQLEHFYFPANHVAFFTSDQPRLAEIEIRLTQPPRLLARQAHGRTLLPRQVASGVVTRVKTWDGWQPASGEVSLSIEEPLPQLAYGQTIRALGMFSRPLPAMNPGEFDWARYYREQRILANFRISQFDNVTIIQPAGASAGALLNAVRQSARSLLAKGFSEKRSLDHALLRALLLGDSDPQLRDIQDTFRRTGTSHHLAISGMHVAVLGAVVYFLCRLIRFSPRTSAWVMMGFVLFYGLVALPAPPVVRSIILCLCFGIGTVLRRSVDGVQLLAFTVFLMLALHPLDLYNAGFQLSFLTVLGLMLMATPLAQWANRQDEDERALLLSGIPPSRMASIRKWLKHRAIADLCAAAVAWAVSAPLIIEHFDQLNPWAIPASLILAIPVFAAMILGLLKIILTLLLPFGASWWAALAALPVSLMRVTVDWLAQWPAGDVALPALPILIILIYYVLLVLPMLPTGRRAFRLAFRGGAVTACLAVLMLPWLIGFAPGNRAGEFRCTLLSVGAGQCAVISTPGGKTILVDAGSSSVNDLHRRILAPYLRHRGISTIDTIYLSHANWDHFSAVADAAEAFHPRKVITTPQFLEHAKKNWPARLMLRTLDGQNIPITTASAGDKQQIDETTTIEFLWPEETAKLDPNNASAVLKLTCRNHRILFPGDIQTQAHQRLATTPNLQSEILIAPHHGSFEPTTAQLLNSIHPTTVIASNDRTLSQKQQALDTHLNHQIKRTHTSGAITIRIDKQGKLTTTTFRGRSQ